MAARNCHKTFVSAAALLDFDVEWIENEKESYLSSSVDADGLDRHLSQVNEKPTAVYITSPDYLGNIADVKAIADVCHSHGVLLCVDNAHGAYLRFLNESRHPIDLGADICCDSAHKTLPVLTGGAYMHISGNAPKSFAENAKDALSLFGSTSPSYLILQSLDGANEYMADGYRERLTSLTGKISALAERLCNAGYSLYGNEPTKLTVKAKKYGYTGTELAEILLEKGIVCEFSDPDYLVLMLTPEISDGELQRLETALLSIKRLPEIAVQPPRRAAFERKMSIREATLSPCEILSVEECEGRVLARLGVSCPPAVPIAVSGEIITREMIDCFKYYGIDKISVVK